jgi:hypothetical protein
MRLHSFPFWLSTDTHIRSFTDHLIFWWIANRQFLRTLNHWQTSPDTKCLWRIVSFAPCRQPSAVDLVSVASISVLYRFVKCPDGLNICFCYLCEPSNHHGSYSSGVAPDKISTLQLHRKREVNGRLCIEEVGVDLELCVHAHGNDVDRHGSFLLNNCSFI